jgi:hypothetical protein
LNLSKPVANQAVTTGASQIDSHSAGQGEKAPFPAELASLIEAWPKLIPAVKVAILALARTVSTSKELDK